MIHSDPRRVQERDTSENCNDNNNNKVNLNSERLKRNFTKTEPKPKLYYKYVLSIFKEQHKMPPLPALSCARVPGYGVWT